MTINHPSLMDLEEEKKHCRLEFGKERGEMFMCSDAKPRDSKQYEFDHTYMLQSQQTLVIRNLHVLLQHPPLKM